MLISQVGIGVNYARLQVRQFARHLESYWIFSGVTTFTYAIFSSACMTDKLKPLVVTHEANKLKCGIVYDNFTCYINRCLLFPRVNRHNMKPKQLDVRNHPFVRNLKVDRGMSIIGELCKECYWSNNLCSSQLCHAWFSGEVCSSSCFMSETHEKLIYHVDFMSPT